MRDGKQEQKERDSSRWRNVRMTEPGQRDVCERDKLMEGQIDCQQQDQK